MRKVLVNFKEIYSYSLEIEVEDNETIDDAIHETDMLIDRDKEWLNEHRNTLEVINEYEYSID